MTIDQEAIEESIVSRLGNEGGAGITRGRQRSEEMVSSAGAALAQAYELVSEAHGSLRGDMTWVALGSIGRLEATDASDVDLILLHDFDVSADDDIKRFDQDIRSEFRRLLPDLKISNGLELTSPTSRTQITDPKYIGGSNDHVNLLTKRALLLTESRTVFAAGDRDLRPDVRSGIIAAFLSFPVTKGKHLLSLGNDLTRYYRTLLVDYKSRVDTESKPWAVRNLKLRHSRKMWFFATALAIVSATADSEDNDAADEKVSALLDLSPIARLAYALDCAELRDEVEVFRIYDRYLQDIGKPEIRAKLDGVTHETRYENAEFTNMKALSDELHAQLLDIIDRLPPVWRRHLLSHFLL